MKKTLILSLSLFFAIALFGCNETTTTTTEDLRDASKNNVAQKVPTVGETCSGIPTRGENGEWIPYFCDEFNTGEMLNTDYWNYETGAGGWGNNEEQYYTSKRSENASISDGTLKLTAIKEDYNGAHYTSARVQTAGKVLMKYGRVDVRAKLPGGVGTWPAIWMMPNSGKYGAWPNSGEIDILEHDLQPGHLNAPMASIHTEKYYWKNNNQISSGYVKNKYTDLTTAFHEYSLIWTETSLTWLIDDEVFFTTEGINKLNPSNNVSDSPSAYWPFDQDFFLILNVAMGGGMGGTISSSFTTSTMEVDYVRMYKKDYTTGDTEAPSDVKNLRALKTTDRTITLSWDASTDDKNVRGYNIFVNNRYRTFVERNVYFIQYLTAGETYNFEVEAVDYAGNVSKSMQKSITTKASD